MSYRFYNPEKIQKLLAAGFDGKLKPNCVEFRRPPEISKRSFDRIVKKVLANDSH